MSQFTLKGGPELLKLLDALPANLAKNVSRGIARAGAERLAEGARSRVHRRTGKIAGSITVTVSAPANGAVIGKVTTKGDDYYKARFLEFGTAAHIIAVKWSEKTGRPAKLSIRTLNRNGGHEHHSLVINGHFVGDAVHHPGARPEPFMGPTLEQDAEDAIKAAADYARDRLMNGGLGAPDVGLAGDDEDGSA